MMISPQTRLSLESGMTAKPSHDETRLNLALVLYFAQKPKKDEAGFVKEYVQFSKGGDVAEGAAMFLLCGAMVRDSLVIDNDLRRTRAPYDDAAYASRMLAAHPFLTPALLKKLHSHAASENWGEG